MSVEYCPACGSNDLQAVNVSDTYKCPGCRTVWFAFCLATGIGTKTPEVLFDDSCQRLQGLLYIANQLAQGPVEVPQ